MLTLIALVVAVLAAVGVIAVMAPKWVRHSEPLNTPDLPPYPPRSAERLARIYGLMERIHRENDFRLRFLGSYSRSDAAKKWKTEYVAYLNEANACFSDWEDLLSSQYMSEETSAEVEYETALLDRVEAISGILERLRDSDEAAEWQSFRSSVR